MVNNTCPKHVAEEEETGVHCGYFCQLGQSAWHCICHAKLSQQHGRGKKKKKWRCQRGENPQYCSVVFDTDLERNTRPFPELNKPSNASSSSSSSSRWSSKPLLMTIWCNWCHAQDWDHFSVSSLCLLPFQKYALWTSTVTYSFISLSKQKRRLLPAHHRAAVRGTPSCHAM